MVTIRDKDVQLLELTIPTNTMVSEMGLIPLVNDLRDRGYSADLDIIEIGAWALLRKLHLKTLPKFSHHQPDAEPVYHAHIF